MAIDLDLEKIRDVLTDAVKSGATFAAEKHFPADRRKGAKAAIQGGLSLLRKVGAAPAKKAGSSRSYDPAAVAAALAGESIDVVAARFGISAETALKVRRDFEKKQKASPTAGAGEAVQQAAV